MSRLEFQPWPKIARLNRDITITEKIDGTNAAVLIAPWAELAHEASEGWNQEESYFRMWHHEGENLVAKVGEFGVFAQSRKQFITPEADNFGFARWAHEHADALASLLGPGRHFGEWWGAGIQRRYGLTEKRFSLFNTARYGELDMSKVPALGVVPVLYQGTFGEWEIEEALLSLADYGSRAAPGFMDPEGIIVFHRAAQQMFKVTIKDDEAPKSLGGAA